MEHRGGIIVEWRTCYINKVILRKVYIPNIFRPQCTKVSLATSSCTICWAARRSGTFHRRSVFVSPRRISCNTCDWRAVASAAERLWYTWKAREKRNFASKRTFQRVIELSRHGFASYQLFSKKIFRQKQIKFERRLGLFFSSLSPSVSFLLFLFIDGIGKREFTVARKMDH